MIFEACPAPNIFWARPGVCYPRARALRTHAPRATLPCSWGPRRRDALFLSSCPQVTYLALSFPAVRANKAHLTHTYWLPCRIKLQSGDKDKCFCPLRVSWDWRARPHSTHFWEIKDYSNRWIPAFFFALCAILCHTEVSGLKKTMFTAFSFKVGWLERIRNPSLEPALYQMNIVGTLYGNLYAKGICIAQQIWVECI